MPRYLVFTLHASLGAFGGVAVGERRPGWDRPGRSAVFGLIAGALGIERTKEAAHLALDRGYGLAIRTDAAGRMLVDYHTAQVPPASRRRPRLPTRAAELAEAELETVLTQRAYRSDALHLIALWERPGAPYSLEALAEALCAPEFVPYVGRKSCPLALPLAPQVIEADDVLTACAARVAAAPAPEQRLRRILRATLGSVAMDAEDANPHQVQRIEQRRDRLASRARWQFALRGEAILRAPPAGEGA
jgi:CRISPR system Cascade subunit CasD